MSASGRDSGLAVPAVQRAIAILRHLQDVARPDQTSLSRIAEAVGLNKSSCSYLLRTLQQSGLVELDTASRSYSLGPGLIGLGAAAARRRDLLKVGQDAMQDLVERTGLTCLVFTQLADKSFTIIGKIDSAEKIKVTIDLGQYFAPGTPALARLAMAQMTPDDADAYCVAHCREKFTPLTKTGAAAIRRDVASVRQKGYAVSQGEYLAGNTVVAAAVSTPETGACRGICLIGFSSQMRPPDLPKLGRMVKATADRITASLGGA